MAANQKYWVVFMTSLVIAYIGRESPQRQMPLDYGAMISRSVPLAIAWAGVLAFSLLRYRNRGLWLLEGAPMALCWPTLVIV